MPQIHRFEYDHWELVDVADLQVGDLISHNGMRGTVKAPPSQVDGQWHVNASPMPDDGPIRVDLGASDTPLLQVMDLLIVSRQAFEDGTSLLLDDSVSPPLIYSPRLPLPELEQFCATHLDKYQAFADEHRVRIDEGYPVPLTPWWPFQDQPVTA